jgi:hypothetical protein
MDARGPAGISCSPAPCVLSPVQASPGPDTVNSTPIAVNPSNPVDIMVGSNDGNCGFMGEPTLGFFISLDAGSAWNQYCMPNRLVNGQPYDAGDGPILGYDLKGNAYIAGWYADGNSGSNVVVEAFEKSSDGIHWSLPARAAYLSDYGPNCDWLAVDTNVSSPYLDTVYIFCVMVGPIQSGKYNQLVVSHSNDGGKTWHQVDVAPQQVAPEQDLFHSMTVGTDGTVYLTWEYCDSSDCFNGPVSMVFSKSSDGGNTWSKPKLVAQVNLIYPLPNVPGAFVANTPAIGVDNSTGPYAGNLYVAMYNWMGSFMQVVVARSTNGGDRWSKPIPVAPGITHDQFFPWLSVSPTGLVGVMWLDRRNDPANIEYQAFAGISADGGLTFQPNVQLTEAFSNPNTYYLGNASYNGAAWDGPNYFLASWMDISNGVNVQDMVGGIRLK